ncbi:hypothetical protein LguiA_005814 [Lonicera macranthoides]
MFRALTIRRSRKGYDRLADDSSNFLEAKLKSTTSLPTNLFSSSKKAIKEKRFADRSVEKEVKKASKIHPVFSIFEKRRRKRATAKPEFARYMEYLKEGGVWDLNSNMPVIYYK